MGIPMANPKLLVIPPPKIEDGVQSAYAFMSQMEAQPNKIVIIAADFTPDTRPELAPMFKSYLELLMRKKIKFAVCSVYPEGPTLADQYTEILAKKYGFEYGRDWAQIGYIPSLPTFIPALMKNVPETVKEDKRGNAVRNLEVFRGIQNHENIQAVLIATGSASYMSWAGLAYGPYKTPLVLGVTGVIVQEATPYVRAGQFVGFLPALGGASQFEHVINTQSGQPLVEEPATGMMLANTFGHIMLLALIILGNIAYFLTRARERRA
jgi:hypothetical protein